MPAPELISHNKSHGLSVFSQDLKELDLAMWHGALEQLERDDITSLFDISASTETILPLLSDATLQSLSSGVCLSFTLSGISEATLLNAIRHTYCPTAVITRMSERPPAGPDGSKGDSLEARIKRSLTTMLLEVAASLSSRILPATLSIKTGLPQSFCEELEGLTLAQIKRTAWSIGAEASFRPRFPESLLSRLDSEPVSAVVEQKFNFAMCEHLLNG
ncbi:MULTISPECIES: hypothetical protein [Halomonas]|uniref:hypothetical protein n=1 Tax=Halomonas TaxID=2745 RepID=UPI003CEFC7F0